MIPSYNSNVDDIKKTFSGISKNAAILVIDDGSQISFGDTVKNILNDYDNLKIFRFDTNQGIESALQTGVRLLNDKYKYIARIDIGDYSPWERYTEQFDYLENNDQVVLVGTWGRFIDEDGNELFLSKLPVNDSEIRKYMFLNNMFIHPSVMMRTDAIKKAEGYNNKYKACEDYDLFFRLMKVGQVSNIPKILVDYEVNFSSISSKKRRIQVINRVRLILKNFKFFKYGVFPYYGVVRGFVMLLIPRELTSKLRTLLKK